MINNLKNQKGITLISLIVYVIVMLMVVTIVGTITSYFYANVNTQYEESKDEDGETTLDMYLTNDLKNKEIEIKTGELEKVPTEGTKTINLIYNDKTSIIYTITNNGIYRNAVKVYNIKDTEMIFTVGNVFTSTSDSIIYEKQELKIEKIVEGQEENDIFKSYIVNVETKAVYETPTPTAE